MTSRYRLEPAQADSDWDNFVHNSNNGTLFMYSEYLSSLNCCTELYYCYCNRELRSALAIIVDEKSQNLLNHDFLIYNGIMFHQPTSGQNRAQQNSEQFRITEFVAGYLADKYSTVRLTLHPSLVDIRPFLWVNYNEDKPKYRVDVRYTSYINISDFKETGLNEDTDAYRNASKSRRQEIRYANKCGITTRESDDFEMFVSLYKQTFQRQNQDVPEEKLQELKRLLHNLYHAGLLVMYSSCTNSGEVASMACFGIDNKRAYYLFGANNPENRDSHTGTSVLWDAFRNLKGKGIAEVDLEGINSPYRGWFKLSFGGDIRPYYELVYPGDAG